MNQQYHRLSKESENDVNRLQKILMAAPSYHLLKEGNLPGTDAALKALQELPPGKSEGDKYFFGIKRSGDYIKNPIAILYHSCSISKKYFEER